MRVRYVLTLGDGQTRTIDADDALRHITLQGVRLVTVTALTEESAPVMPAEGAGPDIPGRSSCWQDVICLLRQETQRMSAGVVHQRLGDQERAYSLSMIEKTLMKMREEGIVTNQTDEYGRGYQLVRNEKCG